jgi:DNA-binding transcriptional LysR family regulator
MKAIPYSGVSLERLEALCLVVQAGSIAQAAVDDPSRQSQFSRQIKDMERALGKPLVEKQGRIVKPTAVGVALATLSQSFFDGFAEIVSDGEKAPVVIAGGESVIRWLVLPKLRRMAPNFPAWRCRNLRTQQTLDGVNSGEVDVGVVRLDAVPAAFVSKDIGSLAYTWVFPRALLPGKTAAGAISAASLPFAALANDGQLMNLARGTAERCGLRLDVRVELESFSLVLDAVQTRAVGAILPNEMAAELSADAFAILDDEDLRLPSRRFAAVAAQFAYNSRMKIRQTLDMLVAG